MFKKMLSFVMVVALFLFDWACFSITNVPVTSVTVGDDIVGVTRISGEEMKYPKENPARVVGDQIVFRKVIALSDVKDFKQNVQGVVYEITTKDGRMIRDIEGKKEGEKFVLPPLSIPLPEVISISVRRIDVGKLILATLGVVVGVFGIMMIDTFSRPYRTGWYDYR
jgi:hypothetical protein